MDGIGWTWTCQTWILYCMLCVEKRFHLIFGAGKTWLRKNCVQSNGAGIDVVAIVRRVRQLEWRGWSTQATDNCEEKNDYSFVVSWVDWDSGARTHPHAVGGRIKWACNLPWLWHLSNIGDRKIKKMTWKMVVVVAGSVRGVAASTAPSRWTRVWIAKRVIAFSDYAVPLLFFFASKWPFHGHTWFALVSPPPPPLRHSMRKRWCGWLAGWPRPAISRSLNHPVVVVLVVDNRFSYAVSSCLLRFIFSV